MSFDFRSIHLCLKNEFISFKEKFNKLQKLYPIYVVEKIIIFSRGELSKNKIFWYIKYITFNNIHHHHQCKYKVFDLNDVTGFILDKRFIKWIHCIRKTLFWKWLLFVLLFRIGMVDLIKDIKILPRRLEVMRLETSDLKQT